MITVLLSPKTVDHLYVTNDPSRFNGELGFGFESSRKSQIG